MVDPMGLHPMQCGAFIERELALAPLEPPPACGARASPVGPHVQRATDSGKQDRCELADDAIRFRKSAASVKVDHHPFELFEGVLTRFEALEELSQNVHG